MPRVRILMISQSTDGDLPRLATLRGCREVRYRAGFGVENARLYAAPSDFAGTYQIYLEQNYRSTGSILAASMAVITQDKSRVQKMLRSSHQSGPLPVLHPFPNDQSEAASIAGEIKRLVAYSGGMLAYGDFAVLRTLFFHEHAHTSSS